MRCSRNLLDSVVRRQPWDGRSLQQTTYKRALNYVDVVGLGKLEILDSLRPLEKRLSIKFLTFIFQRPNGSVIPFAWTHLSGM